jgi:hypothetical protein
MTLLCSSCGLEFDLDAGGESPRTENLWALHGRFGGKSCYAQALALIIDAPRTVRGDRAEAREFSLRASG